MALEEIKIRLGEELIAFSRKEFHNINEQKIELVGNVVIMSGDETIYGERATYDKVTNIATLEGSVRFVSSDITIYGSLIESNFANQTMKIKNARIVTSEFTLNAELLLKEEKDVFSAQDAEFTTCKDCQESWTIFGKDIKLTLNKYIQIWNGLIRVKGVNVLYIPYIAIPIKNKRESGLLFPSMTSNEIEGLGYQQPLYFVLSDYSDTTLTPTFWARRGYGLDVEYRKRFGELRWLSINSRSINDSIYRPNDLDHTPDGSKYFRHFSEIETHYQWSNSLNSHFYVNSAKDLDIIQDQVAYLGNKYSGSELGMSTYLDYRTEIFNYGIEANYNQNLLVNDPEEFDPYYVQVLPHTYFSVSPYPIIQSDTPFLHNVSVGLDIQNTVFRQNRINDIELRNASRINANPYVLWNFFNWGPVGLTSKYQFDYQEYKFLQGEEEDPYFKGISLLQTELAFSTDKIYGLAYEKKIPYISTPAQEFNKENINNESGTNNNLIGKLPEFKNNLTNDELTFKYNSYRHAQEFKLIHHRITSESNLGNSRFASQIEENTGWFDYIDANRANEFSVGENGTRENVPLENTFEFQWNNILIKKIPYQTNYYLDKRFLKDNFDYQKIGHFNISQGITLGEQDPSIENNLTRLYLDTGYTSGALNIFLQEYYFHQDKDHKFTLGVEKRFDIFSLLNRYNYNSLGEENLRSIVLGTQLRPFDFIGLSFLRELDLEAQRNISSTYMIDLMPNNNCWILNVSLKENVSDTRFAFNFIFNFGDERFDQYSRDFFNFSRL